MKKLNIIFLFMLLSSTAFAASSAILVDDSGNALGTASNPLYTSGGGGGGGAGNVGVGTTNYIPTYIGVGTLGPSSMVSVSGNIGIGTALPATTLDVIGTMRATTIQAGTGSATISGDSNGNIGLGTVTAGNKIAIGSTSGSNFDTNGNLGIGTTNIPAGDKLYVAGQITTTSGVKVPTGAGSGYVLVSNSVGLGTWMTPASIGASGGASLWTTGNVGINTTSNVGIGSTNPGATFDVVGSARITNAGNPFTVTGGVNVGIGSANPAALLDVAGAIRIGGNFIGGTTGNVGIGTFGASAATCDSVCNSTNSKRCFHGMTSGGIPTACAVSITGTCICLPSS